MYKKLNKTPPSSIDIKMFPIAISLYLPWTYSIISYVDYISCNGELKARELGKLRSEGKEYTVQDGDVMHFLFNN